MIHRSRPLRLVLVLLSVFSPGQRLLASTDASKSRPIELSVDITEATRRLYRAKFTIPAKPGPLTLVYPKWIPGEHGPTGPINDLAGLTIQAGGKPLPWQRDDVDLFAFHVTVPEGVDAIDVALEYLGPSGKPEARGSYLPSTPNLAMVSWYGLLLYPQALAARDIPVHARLTVPEGWQVGTALPVESNAGTTTTFQTVSLETLADSPALCGRFFKEIPLGTKSGAAHSLVIACDSAEGLNATPEVIAQYQRLVDEAQALFGARHYRSYRFLMTLSDVVGSNGIEHHESSDNRLPERFFVDDKYRKLWTAWLLSHEYVHSWNGKYRRPAGLATPNYQEPMQTRLLWVYEGLTEYLGWVLAARSGLQTPELTQETFATVGASAKFRAASAWRPLADTAVAAPFLYGARPDWSSRRRGTDFYTDGALIWLDADALIREKSDGKKSLDDFCKAFYGGTDGPPEVKPYTFDDVVIALNNVTPYDWKEFFNHRIAAIDTTGPLDGLARSGWQLVYRDKPGDGFKAEDEDDKQLDLRSALGFVVKQDGPIRDIIPGSPADKAGLGPGMKIVAVNSRKLDFDRLKDALAATKTDGKISLLLEDGEYLRTIDIPYDAGPRYPSLERVSAAPDRLNEILKPTAQPK